MKNTLIETISMRVCLIRLCFYSIPIILAMLIHQMLAIRGLIFINSFKGILQYFVSIITFLFEI